MNFKHCFTDPSFQVFIVTILGLILRHDNLGMTSFIRALSLDPSAYNSIEYFFKSASFNLKKVNETWINTVYKIAPLITREGLIFFIIDGVKVAKEARRMVGVKKHHQESENSAKGEFIHGHMFGCVGILIGNLGKMFCLPLSNKIHNGIKEALTWCEDFETWRGESHIVQMIYQTFEAAKVFGRDAVILADSYFPKVPALKALDALNDKVNFTLYLVSKMIISTVAFEDPPPRTGKRGRPPLKGSKVKLEKLFATKSSEFTETEATIYGEQKQVSYYVIDLLWGKKYYKKLRFVLVKYDNVKSILMSTNLNLSGKDILEVYGFRFKIECTFRELKQVLGGFGYRYWNRSMPKLNKYKKKTDPDPLESVTDENDRKNILKTIRAIEMFALCSSIALGILQLCSLEYSTSLDMKKLRYLRTYRGKYASEATIVEYIRNEFNHLCFLGSKLPIIQKIRLRQLPKKGRKQQETEKAG